MNPIDQDPSTDTIHNPLSVMQQGEHDICQIKRHPIGLLGAHISAGLLLIVTGIVIYGVLPAVLKDVPGSRIYGLGSLVFLIMACITLLFLAVAHKVYLGNSWILTTDSLTQVSQLTLFDKQSSQLSLGNLEDVTAEQNGILSHIFNFGNLRVETAGERSKFVFPYCPNPNKYAQQILAARENFEQGRRGDDLQRPYRAQGSYAQPQSGQASSNPEPPQTPVPPAL